MVKIDTKSAQMNHFEQASESFSYNSNFAQTDVLVVDDDAMNIVVLQALLR